MAMMISTGLATHLAGTGSMKSAMDLGFIKIYGGAPPATADAALGGGVTLLCTISLNDTGTGLTLEHNGTKVTKPSADTWSGTNVATGTSTFFRHVLASDDGTASTTQKRIQGTIGLTNALDMVRMDVDVVSGVLNTLENYRCILPLY